MDTLTFVSFIKRLVKTIKQDLSVLSEIESLSGNPSYLDLTLAVINLDILCNGLEVAENDSQSDDRV